MQRELPDSFKQAVHDRLDELLKMYEAGEPLWIVGEQGYWSNDQAVNVRIVLQEPLL